MTSAAGPTVDAEITWLLHRAAQRMNLITGQLAEKHGVTLRDHIVLSALDKSPGMTQVELARTVGLDKTTLMSQLDRLERQGLVIRRPDPRDRRARIPELTPAGDRLRAKVAAASATAETEALNRFRAADIAIFRRVLFELIGDKADPGPLPSTGAVTTSSSPAPALPHPPEEMPEADRRARGTKIYAESFGVPEADLLPPFRHRVGNIFANEAILAAGGPAWNDPGLPDRDRSIAILTALICDGVLGERLEAHLERAVRNGVDQHALEVLMVLLSLYAGQTRTSVAAETIVQFFRERTEHDRHAS